MPRRDGDVFLLGTAISEVLARFVWSSSADRRLGAGGAGEIADKGGLITERAHQS
jgi:hypothetical protein